MLNNNSYNGNPRLKPFVFSFDLRSNNPSSKSAHSDLDLSGVEDCAEIDRDIKQLSSRKLWQVLQLAEVEGCIVDKGFVEAIKQELVLRDDYDDEPWCEPH